ARFEVEGRPRRAFGGIPVAVLAAVIAPTVVASSWAESLAGAVTILAALRLPVLGTVIVGVAAVVVLRLALGWGAGLGESGRLGGAARLRAGAGRGGVGRRPPARAQL